MWKSLLPLIDVLTGYDNERAHMLAIRFLWLCGLWPLRNILSHFTFVRSERTVFGITFPNPIGTAGGFDKHGIGLKGIEAFGFGFAEVGTVTPRPQPGNPKPRLFRLHEDDAIINRMGFNSKGLAALAKRLSGYRKLPIPLGVNLGKNKDTPLEQAADDYEKGLRAMYYYADYITLNISSPNTKDLRQLQGKEYLTGILDRVKNAARECAKGGKPKPILLKIAPDLTNEELDEILATASTRVDGLIIGNTTVARPEYLQSKHASETGGLSGKPLTARALEVVRYAHQKLPTMPIIGAGGVHSADDAQRMFDAGASLIQLYSGLVFEGPFLVSRINHSLAHKQ